MSLLMHDCPRCGVGRTTFDITACNTVKRENNSIKTVEAFSTCRHCNRSSIFICVDMDPNVATFIDNQGGLHKVNGSVNSLIKVRGYVSVKDVVNILPPDHLPSNIKAMFDEGSACKSIQCFNAAAAMFRLCLDTTTKELLPKETEQDDKALKHARKFLHARLEWLFVNRKLPESLRDLAECVREDGNDGAHDGTLTETDVDDVCDFTVEILETVYTAPKRLEIAKERRNARRGGESQDG